MSLVSASDQFLDVPLSHDDYFEPVMIAGLGKKNTTVYFSLRKTDIVAIKERNESLDKALKRVVAVKVVKKMGADQSAISDVNYRLLHEVEARKAIKSKIKKGMQTYGVQLAHCLLNTHEWNIRREPYWVCMEALSPYITLDIFFNANMRSRCNQEPEFGSDIPLGLLHYNFAQVVDALEYLQDDCDITHGDLEASNIVLRYPGEKTPQLPDAVLMDFASAKVVSAENTKDDRFGLEGIFEGAAYYWGVEEWLPKDLYWFDDDEFLMMAKAWAEPNVDFLRENATQCEMLEGQIRKFMETAAAITMEGRESLEERLGEFLSSH